MFQNLNTSFTSYHKPHIHNIDNINRVKKDQIQALIPTKNKDPIINF